MTRRTHALFAIAVLLSGCGGSTAPVQTAGPACNGGRARADRQVENPRDLGSLAGYAQVDGEVNVHDSSLLHLGGLGCLQYAGGLSVRENESLMGLQGLDGLRGVGPGGIRVMRNPVLTSLSGLTSVQRVEGGVFVGHNAFLDRLDGLSGLTRVDGDLVIEDNGSLRSVMALRSLTEVRGDLIIEGNKALDNLAGLESLRTVGQDVIIRRNVSLVHLEGLRGLTSVGGSILIEDNPRLESIEGIVRSLGSVGRTTEHPDRLYFDGGNAVVIQRNASLDPCETQHLRWRLQATLYRGQVVYDRECYGPEGRHAPRRPHRPRVVRVPVRR